MKIAVFLLNSALKSHIPLYFSPHPGARKFVFYLALDGKVLVKDETACSSDTLILCGCGVDEEIPGFRYS